MRTLRNIYAVLVHEQPRCVLDLLRNLRSLDPQSPIVVYNGGPDAALLDALPLESLGAVAHPRPRRLAWGRLHDYALDCMRFGLDSIGFDTLTVVDSDQLATRSGFVEALATQLATHTGAGLLGNAPEPQPRWTRVGPAAALWKEIDLWRPWLSRFSWDEAIYWTFWPSTVFTADAARDLVRLFDTDEQLRALIERTSVWATEEVLLPTIVARLGYGIAPHVGSFDWVRYRVPYTQRQIDTALARPDVFWLHPIPRRYDDRLRRRVRARLGQYEIATPPAAAPPAAHCDGAILQTLPLLARMKQIDGWLDEAEADLLIGAATRALATLSDGCAVVEVGSYCGRSTVVLGSVVRSLRPSARVFAIDPHEGTVGAADGGLSRGPPTFDTFQRNIAAAGLHEVVQPIRQYSYEVAWEQPIGLLLIDGLHDYSNVARDFRHFAPWLVPGGYVAFHDYASYYPGVQRFVDELLAAGEFRRVALVGSMMLVQRAPSAEEARVVAEQTTAPAAPVPPDEDRAAAALAAPPGVPALLSQRGDPLVSCVMPTADRRQFVPAAIRRFLGQDYPRRELVILDDGADSVGDLIPADPLIRYLRLERREILGAKRNLACAAAEGSILIHWDDDDWMAARRISTQVSALLSANAELCGLDTLFFYDPERERAWQYRYHDPRRPWLAGNTLCYTRTFWQRHRFPRVQVGEDTRFVWSERRARIVAMPDPSIYVALIHPGNTSPKRTSDARWQPIAIERVTELLSHLL